MAWKIELSAQVDRDLGKLDPQQSKRILKFLHERLAPLDNPRSIGQALQGSKLGEFWKYRVGDYRLICKIEDDRPLILVLRVGHRREIYRRLSTLTPPPRLRPFPSHQSDFDPAVQRLRHADQRPNRQIPRLISAQPTSNFSFLVSEF